MDFSELKRINGLEEMEDLGKQLYRGDTKDHKEVIVKTNKIEGKDDEIIAAVVYDGQKADVCDECGKIYYQYELELKEGFTLCGNCYDKIPETTERIK